MIRGEINIFFFGLKRIQHRDSIFHQNFGSKLHRSRYFEARYDFSKLRKKMLEKNVYFRTPIALYIPKFIVKNKKKHFFRRNSKVLSETKVTLYNF